MTESALEGVWPEHQVPQAEVTNWIGSALFENPTLWGPIQKLNANNGGFVVRLSAAPLGREDVIFKTNFLPQFRSSARLAAFLSQHCPGDVPHVLAWREMPDRVDTVFQPFFGEQIVTTGRLEALCEMARTLARVQSQVAALPTPQLADLPRLPLNHIPALLDELIENIEGCYWPRFEADNAALMTRFGIPRNLLLRLRRFRPKLDEWSEELRVGGWPESVDHVDLLPHNATILPDGHVLIYDWEQAVLSCPFFSLDVLLAFAQDYAQNFAGGLELRMERETEGAAALRGAYLEALPWKTQGEREYAFDLALCLSPIRYAWVEGQLAAQFGQEEWWAEDLAWWIMRALRRWERMPMESSK